MTIDFRALCAELVDAWSAHYSETSADSLDRIAPIVDRARAALAEGDGVGVTDEEILARAEKVWHPSRWYVRNDKPCVEVHPSELIAFARYGTTHPRPIPVPEESDA